jgi:hypothetical protein
MEFMIKQNNDPFWAGRVPLLWQPAKAGLDLSEWK